MKVNAKYKKITAFSLPHDLLLFAPESGIRMQYLFPRLTVN